VDSPGETGIWEGVSEDVTSGVSVLFSTQPKAEADITTKINIYILFIFYLLYWLAV
jgi:hypothetical protein